MPERLIRKRGGAKRWARKNLNGKFINLAIVPKAGPRGGHSIAGPVHRMKKKTRLGASLKRHRKRKAA